MFASVSHLFSYLALIVLWEFVGGRERRVVIRALSTAGAKENKDIGYHLSRTLRKVVDFDCLVS